MGAAEKEGEVSSFVDSNDCCCGVCMVGMGVDVDIDVGVGIAKVNCVLICEFGFGAGRLFGENGQSNYD